MRRLLTQWIVTVVLLGAVLIAADLGPAPGNKIPPFALPDQKGETQTFDSLKGKQGLMLVFFRSADW